MTVLLDVQGVHKRFGGLDALIDIHLQIERQEIRGLIGPNGAGKTTLFNVLTGLTQANRGQIIFDGQVLDTRRPDRVVHAGIARTFQNIRLFNQMSALENVLVGRHVRTHAGLFGAIFSTKNTRREERHIHDAAYQWLDYVGMRAHAHTLAKNLSYGDQRRLEIARALATEPLLIALDEPAAGMNAAETEGLRSLMHQMQRDGKSILIIEHDVKLVMGLCDHIAVLAAGRKIADAPPADIQKDQHVIDAYLGVEDSSA